MYLPTKLQTESNNTELCITIKRSVVPLNVHQSEHGCLPSPSAGVFIVVSMSVILVDICGLFLDYNL
jgi:hypothetical protein